jgi:hypothetical protein
MVRAPKATPSEKNDCVTASYHTYISILLFMVAGVSEKGRNGLKYTATQPSVLRAGSYQKTKICSLVHCLWPDKSNCNHVLVKVRTCLGRYFGVRRSWGCNVHFLLREYMKMRKIGTSIFNGVKGFFLKEWLSGSIFLQVENLQ